MTTHVNIRNFSRADDAHKTEHMIEVLIPGYESRILGPGDETTFYIWDPLVIEVREYKEKKGE